MHLTEPTSVKDVGIVLGLPATPERVAEDILRTPADHEYAWGLVLAHQPELLCDRGISHPSQIRQPEALAAGIWSNPDHGPYCRAIESLLDSCQKHGVALANPVAPERASLADLALLSKQKRYLLVIAHWRGSRIYPLHWVADPANVREQIARLCEQLDNMPRLPELARVAKRDLTQAVEKKARLDVCTRALDQLIHSGVVLFEMNPQEKVAAYFTCGTDSPFEPGMLASRNRDEIDEFFGPDLLSPGNRLELGSGFCSASEINAALSKHTVGVAFIACQSDILRERITHRSYRRLWGRTDRIMPQGWLFAAAKAVDRIARCKANILTTLDEVVQEITEGEKP